MDNITDTGKIVNGIFRAQLECYKTYSGVFRRDKIDDYTFNESDGEYAVQITDPATSFWVA